MLDDMLTAQEAAALLDISDAAVRQLILRGVLTPVRRVGKSHLLLKSDVLAYQAGRAGRRKPGPKKGSPGRRRDGGAGGARAA